jgi:hypothetical protein
VAQKLKRQTFAIETVAKRGAEGIQNLLSHRHAERDKDLFELPDLPEGSAHKRSESLAGMLLSDSEEDDDLSETEAILESLGVDTSDIYKLDVESEHFKSLPKHVQYDILYEMREKRKQVKNVASLQYFFFSFLILGLVTFAISLPSVFDKLIPLLYS